ncbi:PAS domain S-box protein [Methanobacterium paludis]|uniref:Signal transduction histidine kinase n=1 Tax=Methanobacterium paludis (strain DSM 25820 / JCM 18151 / SWAN1) TaxID=868131 RepID=F6D1J2_METPW|nr:PAS domain S-box protein [Methanobacterium paludis]AEG17220.1 signal transduction histidine kinase [Methanobacterium paludis]
MSGSKRLPELHGKKERDLFESEAYYRAIFENTGAATLFLDEDASITLVNNEFQKLTGYLQKDLDGKKWLDIISDEDSERVDKYHNLRMINPKSAPRNYEFRFKKKDGSIGDAFITIATIPGTKKSIASFIDITERKKAEKSLMLSQERYRAIVEDQKDMISRFLPDGTLTFVNEAQCKFFGVDKEPIIGSSFFDFLSVDGRRRIEEFIKSISKKNYKGMTEDVWKYSNGEMKWIRWYYSVIFKDKCDIAEIQASGRDITDLKESERKLKESEKKFRTLAETASDAIFIADSSGKLTFCNDAALSLYGYKKGELAGKQVEMLVPEETRLNFEKGFERYNIDNKYTFIGNMHEILGLRKDGSKFPIDISLSTWKINGKRYITSIIRDITQRNESEKRIRFQANILENVWDSVIVTDLHGKIIYWNKGASSIFGYSPEEAIGSDMALICHNTDKKQFERDLDHVLNGKDCVKENECMRKDGSKVWMDVRVTKMLDSNGNLAGFLNVSKDITERKKSQNDISAALEEKEMLLEEIHERVTKYMQMIADLFQLQLDIEHTNNSESLDSKSRVKSISMIYDGLIQSDDFGIIDFSEYIRNLIKGIIDSYGVDENIIKFDITFDSILDIYTAIPCGLISNELVTNSIKYAFPKGINGKICIDFNRDDYGNCVLTIEDNGVGFPEGLDFESTNRIGLKLVKTLVKQLNGTIDLVQNNGTKFQIKFKELEY